MGAFDWFNPELQQLWTRAYFHLGEVAVSPAFLVRAFIFLIFLTTVMRVGRHVLRRHVLERTSLDDGQKYALDRGFGYALFSIGLLIGLQSAGLNLSSLAFLGGAVGIGVGFGLKNIARNFLSGLVLLAERPMRVSDRVQVGDVLGEVIHIGFRATWVRTDDNVVVIVPNCELVENYVTNWSSNDRKIRHIIPVSVPSGSDSSRVSEVLLNATRQHPDVLLDPPAEVRLKAFHERGLDFELLVWSVATNHAAFRSEITLRAYQAFRSYGVIPTV